MSNGYENAMSTRKVKNPRSGAQRRFRTSAAERAFFADSCMGYVVAAPAIAVFTLELTANVVHGAAVMSTLHFFVIGPSYVFLVALLARALFSRVQRRGASPEIHCEAAEHGLGK